jgi:integrase
LLLVGYYALLAFISYLFERRERSDRQKRQQWQRDLEAAAEPGLSILRSRRAIVTAGQRAAAEAQERARAAEEKRQELLRLEALARQKQRDADEQARRMADLRWDPERNAAVPWDPLGPRPRQCVLPRIQVGSRVIVLDVTRVVIYDGGGGHASLKPYPKGRRRRTVPVAAAAAPLVQACANGRGPREPLFSAPDGGLLHETNWRRAVGWTSKTGHRPHDLRHTAASLFIAAGADLKCVQALLGHQSSRTTHDTYGHLLSADHLSSAVQRLDHLVGVELAYSDLSASHTTRDDTTRVHRDGDETGTSNAQQPQPEQRPSTRLRRSES